MNYGRFFKLDTINTGSEYAICFRYKKLYQDGFLPVYMVLSNKSLTFYYSSKSGFANNVLMEFHFSDYENPSGKLGRQINDIITQKYFAIPDESLLQMEKNDPEYVNHVSRSNELSNWSKLNHVTEIGRAHV